jgi:hypothetical protein
VLRKRQEPLVNRTGIVRLHENFFVKRLNVLSLVSWPLKKMQTNGMRKPTKVKGVVGPDLTFFGVVNPSSPRNTKISGNAPNFMSRT